MFLISQAIFYKRAPDKFISVQISVMLGIYFEALREFSRALRANNVRAPDIRKCSVQAPDYYRFCFSLHEKTSSRSLTLTNDITKERETKVVFFFLVASSYP